MDKDAIIERLPEYLLFTSIANLILTMILPVNVFVFNGHKLGLFEVLSWQGTFFFISTLGLYTFATYNLKNNKETKLFVITGFIISLNTINAIANYSSGIIGAETFFDVSHGYYTYWIGLILGLFGGIINRNSNNQKA